MPGRKRAASSGNQVPVRIRLRVPQFRCDPIFQPLGNEMLQPFRLVVNLVPGVVQEVVEKPLQQAMMTNNFQARIFPAAVKRTP